MRSVDEIEGQAQRQLLSWLSAGAKVRLHPTEGADLVVQEGAAKLVVEVKRLAEPGWLRGAIEQLRVIAQRLGSNAVPVIAVPFMAEGGRRLCEEANVSWFDLSGNAHIVAPGLLIHVEGKPNTFKRRGRPSTVFAPKSSRIVRALLLQPQSRVSQRELARRTGLDEGFTSRVVRKLEADRMVERDADGAVKVTNPDDVLESWRAAYDFSKHRVIAGHATARSGDELLTVVGRVLREKKLDYAATGLAGAWMMTKFAAFRLATVFVPEEPPAEVLNTIRFRPEERGANLWFTIPNDEGVFTGSADFDGVHCVHPLQAYLDLKSQPERSAESGEELRRRFLRWSQP
jgi:hypothetical protein